MNSQQLSCKHESFIGDMKVARLTEDDTPDAEITGYSMDVRVKCSQCDLPFEFIGLPQGYSVFQPMVSVDNLELRAPIKPQL
jgi:hypothetical protein